jgi:hypothetical protein
MDMKTLLGLDLQEAVSVANKPFTYVGKSEVTLDDETVLYWFYDDDDAMLSIAPDDEELILFTKIEEEIEPDDSILYQSKEHEFSYEAAGTVTKVEGDSITEEEDRYLFSDYQSAEGQIVRLISNENTGEVSAFVGRVVSEDDVSEI